MRSAARMGAGFRARDSARVPLRALLRLTTEGSDTHDYGID